MKTLKYFLALILFLPPLINAQSIVDISSETEIEIGLNAEICADMQTGSGILSGLGTFCGGTLPVELTSFTSSVQNGDVTLLWVTATETNNSGFDIERSEISTGWNKIGFAEGNGNSNTPKEYSFTDRVLNPGKYKYRLKQIDFNGNYEYYELSGEVNIGVPVKFELSQNYPNPFNPSTKINYAIPFDGRVSLKIFDMTGKELTSLVNTFQTAGYYTVIFNITEAGSLTSGTYFYKLFVNAAGKTEEFTAVKKMILVK